MKKYVLLPFGGSAYSTPKTWGASQHSWAATGEAPTRPLGIVQGWAAVDPMKKGFVGLEVEL